MEERRVTPGEVLAAVAALTMFGLMWGIWFEHPQAADIPASAIGFETRPDAWHAFAVIDIVLLITVLCAVCAALLRAAGKDVNLPLDTSAIVAVMGAVAVVVIGYRIIDPVTIDGVSYRRDLAIFLAFGAAGLTALGGLLALREKGTSLARELARAAGRQDDRRARLRVRETR